MKKLVVNHLSDLPEAASEIIELLDGYNVIALHGAMGVGKTTLIREIAAQMGVKDNVTSPTFALVNQYNAEGGRKLYHFDFYRINKIEEAYDFGYEEYFYGGDLCFVEWPEKVAELIPDDALIITIEEEEDSHKRVITIE